eukprot:7454119-Pyramimonas_sp.AAC.1
MSQDIPDGLNHPGEGPNRMQLWISPVWASPSVDLLLRLHTEAFQGRAEMGRGRMRPQPLGSSVALHMGPRNV